MGAGNKLLITMRGGVIQEILAEDTDVDIEIIDYDDNLDENEADLIEGEKAEYFQLGPDGQYTKEIQKAIHQKLKRK